MPSRKDVQSGQQSGPTGGDPFGLLANCFLFFCMDPAVFVFPMLIADFKDTLQNQDRVPAVWAKFYIAHPPSIHLLKYALV